MAQEHALDELRSIASLLELDRHLTRDVWLRLARRPASGNLFVAVVEELAHVFAEASSSPLVDTIVGPPPGG